MGNLTTRHLDKFNFLEAVLKPSYLNYKTILVQNLASRKFWRTTCMGNYTSFAKMFNHKRISLEGHNGEATALNKEILLLRLTQSVTG